jgi:hypothetical protein
LNPKASEWEVASVTTGKSIAIGAGIGVTAYLAVVACLALNGVKMGELGQFPDYVRCLAKVEATQADAQQPCGQLRSYFEGDDDNPWRIEQLAAKTVATVDRLKATAKNDRDEIKAKWITPIVRRLDMAVDVAKDIFLP